MSEAAKEKAWRLDNENETARAAYERAKRACGPDAAGGGA